MVVLAAMRAGNTGRPIQILTSDDQSDDTVCKVLDEYALDYFRGSLGHVLKRFFDALKGFSDETRLFRLTADNVLPDGTFLDEMEARFEASSMDILCCDSEESGMPYGLSAELTTVGWVREAFWRATDPFDTEHVTPFIYKHGLSQSFKSSDFKGYQNLRVTVDTSTDYLRMVSLFNGVSDPINVDIKSLLAGVGRKSDV